MSETPIPLFADLNLSAPLLRVLQDLGYELPSPIQAATIPILLDNRDVIGQAQTGTGKTAAFALPLLQRMMKHENASTSPARRRTRRRRARETRREGPRRSSHVFVIASTAESSLKT